SNVGSRPGSACILPAWIVDPAMRAGCTRPQVAIDTACDVRCFPSRGPMPRPVPLLVVVFLTGCAYADGPPPARYRLDNGLTAIPRPVAGAKQVAVLTLYAIGSDHDPKGRSGLAHLVEHLYYTAAAGGTPARTFEQFVQLYPLGWQAQTSSRF